MVAYQRLADARVSLKHSVLLQWTVLLSKWFQAMIVLGGKKECLYYSVLQRGTVIASVIVLDIVFHRVCVFMLPLEPPVDLLDQIQQPYIWGVRNASGVISKGLILRKFCVRCLCMFCFM